MVKRYYRALCNRRTLDFLNRGTGSCKPAGGFPPLGSIRCYDAGYYVLALGATAAEIETFGPGAMSVFEPFIRDGKVAVYRFTPRGEKLKIFTVAGCLPACLPAQ